MPTPYRGYSELPGAVVPDVPYRVNMALREVDLDVHDIKRLTDARLGVLEHSAGLGDKPLAVQDSVAAQLLRTPESATAGAAAELVERTAPESVGAAGLSRNSRWYGPLRKWGDALAAKTTAPCIWVSLGSSTAAGAGASEPGNSWVNRVAARLTASPVAALNASASRPANGVRVFNGAVSGATTSNYLDDVKVEAVRRLRPALITHMIGSNDWGSGVLPGVYAANMRSALKRLLQASPDTVHVLIHQQTRQDHNPATSWEEYGRTLAGVAAEFPNNAVYLNAHELFAGYGLTRTEDLAGLLTSDRIHVNDGGHRILADLTADYLGTPMLYRDEYFRYDGPYNGGVKTAEGIYAKITVPARPYPRRVDFTVNIFAGADTATDIQLRKDGVYVTVIRVEAGGTRSTRTATSTWTVPAHTPAVLELQYGAGMYLTSSDLYAHIFATTTPV